MGLLKLSIDRQSSRLVSFEGGTVTLPPLVYGDIKGLKVKICDPTGRPNAPYERVNLSSQSLRVSIGQTPTGTAGGPTPLALQTVFTWNVGNDEDGFYFTGKLDLTDAAIGTYLGTLDKKEAFLEVKLLDGVERDTVLPATSITIKAPVDEVTASAPSPADGYLTQSVSDSRYLLKSELAGVPWQAKSLNGLYGGLAYLGDDGSWHFDVITL